MISMLVWFVLGDASRCFGMNGVQWGDMPDGWMTEYPARGLD